MELTNNQALQHYNLGVKLHKLGKLDEAEVSYKKAIELKPNYFQAHNNLGSTLQKIGKLDESEASYKKAIKFKPDFVQAHNNLGLTLQKIGKLDEAEASFKQAMKFRPDIPEIYNNLGNLLKDIGRFEDAKANYKKAIELKPDFVIAHYMLSKIKNFNKEDDQLIQMQKLNLDKTITDAQHCRLSFALGKASEDLNQFDKSFKYYSEGNALRKKLLNYNIRQDIELFDQLKKTYPIIEKNSLKTISLPNKPRLIFILGMHRSGTTLVEQIISSHSEVLGAGELPYVRRFGDAIARGISKVNTKILVDFRESYLKKLKELSNKSTTVTDKMPSNFKYVGLICSAFPDAKIVHVKRNSAATCWGNYKQHFTSKTLGYSYDLDSLITYYGLYQNLMQFWEEQYGDRIYTLNYETLTINQEDETRKLIQYLDLKWEQECLSPQNNKRNVSTSSSSSKQIRQKVYQDSSLKWKKFEPFLNGAFNQLDD